MNAERVQVTSPNSEVLLMQAFEDLVAQAGGNHLLAALNQDEIARAVDWLHAKYGSKP